LRGYRYYRCKRYLGCGTWQVYDRVYVCLGMICGMHARIFHQNTKIPAIL
jgi:hypothetical protein